MNNLSKISEFRQLTDDLMSFSSLGIRPGLERTSRLLSCLGDPQKKFRTIHVLGTNGKGSTAATIDSILRQADVKTALYTSPHLISLQERLLVGGEGLQLEKWHTAFECLKRVVSTDAVLNENRPTFFENLTALCFLMMAESDVDIAIVEAGMGGRYDATSTAERIATIITPIGMDHMQYLGDTLEAIASEKFAAVKRGVPAFYAGDNLVLSQQFVATCAEACAPCLLLDEIDSPRDVRCSLDGTTYSLLDMEDLHTPLIGTHQAENTARAILALRALSAMRDDLPKLGESYIRNGLSNTKWPGRFEVFRMKDGLSDVIIDGAHNEHGMRSLVETVRRLDDAEIGAVVFAVMKDKEIRPVLEELSKLRVPIYCTRLAMDRAMPQDELKQMALESGLEVAAAFEEPFDALNAARTVVDPDKAVLCCGSLFLVGHIREALA